MSITGRLRTAKMTVGALGVVVAYMLLAQAIFAGLSQGLMLGAAVQPQAVICSVHGPSLSPVLPGEAPDQGTKCPCAILCQLGSSFSPAIAVLATFVQEVSGGSLRLALPAKGKKPVPDGIERFVAEARAPPQPFA